MLCKLYQNIPFSTCINVVGSELVIKSEIHTLVVMWQLWIDTRQLTIIVKKIDTLSTVNITYGRLSSN